MQKFYNAGSCHLSTPTVLVDHIALSLCTDVNGTRENRAVDQPRRSAALISVTIFCSDDPKQFKIASLLEH